MEDRQGLLDRLFRAQNIIRPTPIVRLEEPVSDGLDIYAKLEYSNGIGSIKDRPALWILKEAIERGDIGPHTTVIESSSGNFACAVAVCCRMLEIDFVPVIDPNISSHYEQTLRGMCADVVKVTERDDTGGFLKTRLRKVQELIALYGDAYWPNQYENLGAVAAHYHLTGAEIAQVPLDYVFVGVSTGGTIAGVSQRLKRENPNVRVIAVDAEGSVIFGGAPKRRHLPGLGSSISPGLVGQAEIDDVVMVPEIDAVRACQELLDRHRLFVGASTGSVYSAIQRYFSGRSSGSAPARVLFMCCDRGSAYLDTVFDPNWAAWREAADLQDAEAMCG
ncbi:2,3-diaminopropionate biosynthesis protein SbnA [Sphingomonas qomolangmaensis]|uniref:2,3-diaminopropionate biosynthesis protein SbnA n=1 Tax=Sphingomonas qomolangmaensis TaxID=2918765 RepID=A0ABY5L8N6_9SPHN|nr:2,3-diaminopropionate biosynthesis protein SbnA [Sphingomonas qomolangmaensis]UUL82316.1 2,3-diaminopropionate biosynthesis protein SbnA [Sphingomonas qomolangmaensis]